ncbi:DJ-1/PfpI family protein [Cytophagaceae bacterium YF14B1]|uniref:DJ-1/PfpI family protein n=1 Tax=Xanthocytophaga flava TaxID=3048013 RepID=A0AAE3QWN7_9BACT|nr:DJ-1/PfpI family protein [Xanthocytophaga flavus]MDJ1483878.1 DJ-1/PfpI family protein [Xanthocytophaga flavus]
MNKLLTLFMGLLLMSISFQSFSQMPVAYVCPPCNSQCDTLSFDKPGVCTHCGMPLVLKNESKDKLPSPRKKIAFYLQDGIEILDFAGPLEVFTYAGFDVFTVSKTKAPIKAQGLLTVTPDYSIQDAPKADILAFFGGSSNVPASDPDVIKWVQSQQNIEYYFSVCTGAFVLGEAGLLKGKTATTFHSSLDNLEKSYPETKVLKNVRFVDNGNLITTAGISAGIDGALHLVAKLNGFDAARKTAYYMEYDKWTPGEGLILTEYNPYKALEPVDNLKLYTGTYEFNDGSKIQIKVSEREKGLYAIVRDRNYPLFFTKENTFTDANGKETITFIRDKRNRITGYTLSQDPKVFHKLN